MSSSIYFCRNCKLPLVIDESLEELSHAQQHLLTLNYGERPQPSMLRNGNGSDIKPSPNDLDSDGNIYNEYPMIPGSRMKIFKDAINSSGNKTPMNRVKSEIKNNSNNFDEAIPAANKELKNGENSFVYLADKAQNGEDDDVFDCTILTSTTSNSINSLKPFKNQDIKDLLEKKSDISERVDSLDTIFNIISSKYEIDYPVCSDCATTLISQMKIKYETLNKEKDTYMQFLKKLTAQNGPNVDKTKNALRDIEILNEKEQSVLNQLAMEEKRHLELNKELKELEDELAALEKEEQTLCQKTNDHELEIQTSLNELGRVKNKYYNNLDFLDSLRKTNVFNNFFNISHDGDFGTINGLRLGSLADIKVTWHEINAALGQLILLLSTCLNILSLDLDGYKLIPMSSTSKIEKYEKDSSGTGKLIKSVIQLYCTGEFSLGGFFSHNNLDVGMVCLVDVLKQISAHIKTLDSSFQLPYVMDGEKVAGFSVRPSNRSGWDSWTNGCRCLLINVKWIMAFCVAHYEEKLRGD